MVTVKKLISELKKMPQNLEVGIALPENRETEVAGWVCTVIETTDDEYEGVTGERCVVLRC